MRDAGGIELVRAIMEDKQLAKLEWGADGDLACLLHQPNIVRCTQQHQPRQQTQSQPQEVPEGQSEGAPVECDDQGEGEGRVCRAAASSSFSNTATLSMALHGGGITCRSIIDVQLVYSDSIHRRRGMASALGWLIDNVDPFIVDDLSEKGGQLDYAPQVRAWLRAFVRTCACTRVCVRALVRACVYA